MRWATCRREPFGVAVHFPRRRDLLRSSEPEDGCVEAYMTLDKLASALAKGGQHLGDIVYWTLSEARVDRSTLEHIWNAASLSPAMLPDPPPPRRL
jgi:hypothetical protein